MFSEKNAGPLYPQEGQSELFDFYVISSEIIVWIYEEYYTSKTHIQ